MLESLPNEMILQIAKNLSPEELGTTIARVNKHLAQIAATPSLGMEKAKELYLKTKEIRYITANENTAEFVELLNAISADNLQAVEKILNKRPELINTIIKPINDCALSRAIHRANINYAMLALLRKFHVNVNVPINQDEMLPIELACQNRNLELTAFLMKHHAVISPLTPHYLLARTTDIKHLTAAGMTKLIKIITLLGGLENIKDTLNSDGMTFKNNAKACKLINSAGGSMKVDMWELLTLTKKESFFVLNSKIEPIHEAFLAQARADKAKLGTSFSFFTRGRELIPQREVKKMSLDSTNTRKSP